MPIYNAIKEAFGSSYFLDNGELDRKKFKHPQREDKYSTSVLSIQFNKEARTSASIKSRYNHTVENPDATYGNDLDKIVLGLADSFSRLIASRGCYYTDANITDARQ